MKKKRRRSKKRKNNQFLLIGSLTFLGIFIFMGTLIFFFRGKKHSTDRFKPLDISYHAIRSQSIGKLVSPQLKDILITSQSRVKSFGKLVETLANEDKLDKKEFAGTENLLKEEIERKIEEINREQEMKQRVLDEKRKRDFENLAAKQLEIFDQKLSATFDRVERKIVQNLEQLEEQSRQRLEDYKRKKDSETERETTEKEMIFKQKLAEVQEQDREEHEVLKQAQLEAFQARLLSVEDRMRKRIALLKNKTAKDIDDRLRAVTEENKKMLKIQREEQVLNEKWKKEQEEISRKMLHLIEAKLDNYGDRLKPHNVSKFNVLFGKLKNMHATRGDLLVDLDRRLELEQRKKMNASAGGAISQEEVDDIVRREVNRQLNVMKFRKDPRVARLKKVVALEKMRRLIKGLANKEEDFDHW